MNKGQQVANRAQAESRLAQLKQNQGLSKFQRKMVESLERRGHLLDNPRVAKKLEGLYKKANG